MPDPDPRGDGSEWDSAMALGEHQPPGFGADELRVRR